MKSHILKITAALAAFGFATSAAHAVAIITLNDGVNPLITVNDNGAGDSNANAGAVVYAGSVGTWYVAIGSGVTKPIDTNPQPSMHLSAVGSSTGAGSLTITFTDTFTFAQAHSLVAFGGGAQSNGTTSYSVNVAGTNYNLGTSGAAAPQFLASVIPFGSGNVTITQTVVLTHTAGGSSSFDAHLNRTPDAGSTMALLGGVLVALGLIRRRLS